MNQASKVLMAVGFTLGLIPRTSALTLAARSNEKEQAQQASDWGVVQRLGWDTLRSDCKNGSSTAFILGAGASIRELGEEKLCHIASNVSAALNSWLTFSDFVPTFVLAEDITRIQWDAVEKFADDSRLRAILVTRYAANGLPRSRIRSRLPHLLEPKTHHYSTVPLLGRGRRGTQGYFEHLVEFARLNRTLTGPTSTSLERAIVMLGLSGYRRIVLCGVDLRGPYWWDESAEGGAAPVLTDRWRVVAGPVSKRLPILADVMFKRFEVSVEVASDSVSLSERLPVYDGWDV